MNRILRILGIVLIVLSIPLLVVPPAGIAGIVCGVFCIIRSSKKLSDKINTKLSKSIEKTKQREKMYKEKIKSWELKPNQKNSFPEFGSVIYTEREIPDDSEEARLIRAKQDSEENEIITGMIQDIKSSPFFISEKIPELINLMGEKNAWANHRNIPKEAIDYLSEKGLKRINSEDIDPDEIISNIYFQNSHKVARRRDLLRMKETGIKKVRIEDCGDERDCKAIKRFRKIWPIDEVPELPLPNCKADYCRCTYIAHNIFD